MWAHLLNVPINNLRRWLAAFFLAIVFFFLPNFSKQPEVKSRQEGPLGYVINGGEWVTVSHLLKPKRWRILAAEWPLCVAATITDQSQRPQLEAFLTAWPGWLSVSVPGPSLAAVKLIVQEISLNSQNILDQVSFHAVFPAVNTSSAKYNPPPTHLLVKVAAENSPCDWVAVVEDVALRPPPDDGPNPSLESVLSRLGKETPHNCLRAAKYEVLNLESLPTSIDQLPIYNEFGALKRKASDEVILARQGPALALALKGVCKGPMVRELFFAKSSITHDDKKINCLIA